MPISDTVLLLLLVGGLFALLVAIYRYDRSYRARKTSEIMSDQVRDELEVERAATLIRKKKFETALEQSKGPQNS